MTNEEKKKIKEALEKKGSTVINVRIKDGS